MDRDPIGALLWKLYLLVEEDVNYSIFFS